MRCVRAVTPPPPPPVQVPAGCLRNQSGEYVHAGNPAYRYLGRDDGGTLVLVLEEGPPADGGARPALPASPRVVLDRTSHGFVGHTEARTFSASGQVCAASFPTEVVACPPDGLTLRAAFITLDDQCQVTPPPPGTPPLEHRLLRKSLAADGGAG
jgi:hypothetical protein